MSGGIAGGAASGIELLLRILDDPETLRAKLEQFATAAKNADELIALAAPASEIPVLREKLRAEMEGMVARRAAQEQECSVMLDDARLQARGIVEDAKAEAGRIVGEAETLRESARRERDAAVSERTTAEQLRGGLAAKHEELRSATSKTEQERLQLQEQTAALAKEQERLRKARERLAAELG
jgi:cell division septum initiation protein DivIVA